MTIFDTNVTSYQTVSVSQTGSEGTSDVARSKKGTVGIGSAAGSATTPTPGKNRTLSEGTDAINYYLSTHANESISDEALDKVVAILKEVIEDFEDVLEALSSDTDPVGINLLTNEKSISDDFADFPKRVKDLLSLLAEVANLQRGEFSTMIKDRNNSIVSKLQDAAQKLKDSADHMLTGAVASLVFSMAATVITLGMSIKAAKPTYDAYKASKPNDALKTQLAQNQTKLDSPESAPGIKEGLTAENSKITAQMNANSERANEFLGKAQHFKSSGEALASASRAAGQFAEAHEAANSKRIEADGQVLNAEAQSEQAFRDVMLQAWTALKSFADMLNNTYREIRDNQDQVKANIAKNT